MKITKFSFRNKVTGWHVKDVALGNLSLLVGASGVGKTQILKAIYSLSRIVDGKSLKGIEWKVDFEEAGIEYEWEGEFESESNSQEEATSKGPTFVIVRERLAKKSGEEIFSRKGAEVSYHHTRTVKLDSTQSAVELLKEETDVSVVKRGFKKIIWLDMDDSGIKFRVGSDDISNIEALTMKEIKNLKYYTPIQQFFLIHKYHPGEFNEIVSRFSEIFPLVEKMDFDLDNILKDIYFPVLKIKEKGVGSWIRMPDISSGMCRTLIQIIVLYLADDGDVILIDEFENGLGINCIDMLAEMAMEPETEVQVIMTSHHPYIINAIPFQDWKIVSRAACEVKVNKPSDFKIGEHSKHDAFMQLIQNPTYRTGQA